MSEFSVIIEHDLFSAVGTRTTLDVDGYQQLLRELRRDEQQPPESPELLVHLYPKLSWLRRYSFVDKDTLREVYSDAISGGSYCTKDKVISVACSPDERKASQTLLHETEHWRQDMSGEMRRAQRRLDVVLAVGVVGFIGGAAGVATGIYTKNADLIAGSATAAVASPVGTFRYIAFSSKTERQADRFQGDPEILAAYGGLIRMSRV
ncbi:MAG TPA: hypothetical protein VLF43_05095 [Candidatus Saccharimonadales bacterium]|nr:hypothetical protein [Candidatus Saccharimonadales bacterium]